METEELVRRAMVDKINSEVETTEEDKERARLEAKYGQVWDTQQLQEDFSVQRFLAPMVIVTRKSDGAKGTLDFQHHPRFYFNFLSRS